MSSRRRFLRNSSLLALSVPFGKSVLFGVGDGKLARFGIQLYMVRDEMEKNPHATLNALGRMGYRQIESYGGSKGIYWGMTNMEFKKLASDSGLSLISTHYNDDKTPFEKKAETAAETGMKYLICPWRGPQKSIDDFKRIADDFNSLGAVCKKFGLRFGYHLHDYPYVKVDGQLPVDVVLANTDPGLVDLEMDFYYVVIAGLDPEAYLKKYPGRFRLCHMRDVLKKRLPAGSKEESACDLGQGIIDYPRLTGVALNSGVEYFFVEQSRFYRETEMQSARVNAGYLKNMLPESF